MNLSDDKKFVVEIRVRGESDEDLRGHDWYYFQVWDGAAVERFLRTNMRKDKPEIGEVLKAYERFEVEIAIKPETAAECEAPVGDDLLLNADPV